MATPPNVPDLSTSKWSSLADIAVPRRWAAAAAMDENRLVVIGGCRNQNDPDNRDSLVAESFGQVYDLRTNHWTPLTSNMLTPRYGCKAVCMDNGKLYVLGGYDQTGRLQTVEMFDFSTRQWTELAPFKENYVYDFNAVAVGRWIYIVGSKSDNASTGERFHVDTGTWDTYPPLERPAVASAVAAVGTKIHVMGGWNPVDRRILSRMDVFDTATQTWETRNSHAGPTTSRPRSHTQAVVLANRYIVVTGGFDARDVVVNTTDIYDTQTEKWRQLPLTTKSTARVEHMSVVLGKCRVIVLGGEAGGSSEILNTVEQLALWQLQPLAPAIPRAQQLFSDSARGDDLLGVEEVARALADTIALKDLKPPFTAGILGHWGSGKSFFVELVRRRLVEIQEYDLTDAQVAANFPFVGHVYLVKFDVWTFAKGNLWASMMYQILVELNNQLDLESRLRKSGPYLLQKGVSTLGLMDQLSKGEQDYLKRLVDIGIIDGALKEELDNMPLNLSTATQALAQAVDLHYDMDQARLRLLKREYALGRMAQDPENRFFHKRICLALSFWGALASKTDEESASPNDSVKQNTDSTDNSSAVPSKGGKFMKRCVCIRWLQRLITGKLAKNKIDTSTVDPDQIEQGLQGLDWFRRSIVQVLSGDLSPVWALPLALIAILGYFIPDMLASRDLLDDVEILISWIGVLVPVCVGISVKVQNAQKSLAKLKTAYANASEKHTDLEGNDRLRPREQNAGSDDEDEERPLVRLQNIRGEIAELEERLWLVQGDSIDAVVRKRLESSGYENHLGVIHKAQQDLARLTRAFLDEKKAESVFPRGKPRIVLMIDDLDRCPPDKVVETLEAAQLLVKTELFVVVMAIDARYVSLALEKKYEGILIQKKCPCGMDYLEKIIQLPYRLPTIDTPEAMNFYLRNQMGEMERPGEDSPTHLEDAGHGPEQPGDAPNQSHMQSPEQPPADPSPQPSPESSSGAPPQQQAEASQPVETIPPTVALKFKEEELTLLSTVCIAAGVSPRAGKRLVNVFKLLKVMWHRQDEQRTEMDDQNVWSLWTRQKSVAERHREAREASILLLAMCASPYKDLHFCMGGVFESVERCRSMPKSGNLRDLVLEGAADEGAIEPCRHLVDEWLVKVRWSNDEEWIEIRHYLRLVRSFSFVVPLSSKDL